MSADEKTTEKTTEEGNEVFVLSVGHMGVYADELARRLTSR